MSFWVTKRALVPTVSPPSPPGDGPSKVHGSVATVSLVRVTRPNFFLLLIGSSWSASPLVSVSAVVSALQLVPMSSRKKFALVTLTRETVAADRCTLEGPSPGGDGPKLAGT